VPLLPPRKFQEISIVLVAMTIAVYLGLFLSFSLEKVVLKPAAKYIYGV